MEYRKQTNRVLIPGTPDFSNKKVEVFSSLQHKALLQLISPQSKKFVSKSKVKKLIFVLPPKNHSSDNVNGIVTLTSRLKHVAPLDLLSEVMTGKLNTVKS